MQRLIAVCPPLILLLRKKFCRIEVISGSCLYCFVKSTLNVVGSGCPNLKSEVVTDEMVSNTEVSKGLIYALSG
jgi:hypothetical protein